MNSWIRTLFILLSIVNIYNIKAFLEDELPLEISAIAPSSLNDTSSETIFKGVEEITIVFSRAVIALGSDFSNEEMSQEFAPFFFNDPLIVGRGRWVTTSIYRWDPIDSWPLDIKTNLTWIDELTTYDGVKLNLNEINETIPIKTESLKMERINVKSEKAMELTDSLWDAYIGTENDKLPEVPPDASFELKFNIDVYPDLIKKDILFYNENDGKNEDFNISVTWCEVEEDDTDILVETIKNKDCISIKFNDLDLRINTTYQLIIPKDTVYNEKCGPLQDDILENFYGLRDFKLPFNETKFEIPNDLDKIPVQNDDKYINGRNVTIWLPHGLSEDTTIDEVKSILFLENIEMDDQMNTDNKQVPYELQLTNKGQLNLIAEFEPGLQYKIYTLSNDSFVDGFGLPLQESSINFYTSKLEDYAAVPHKYSNMDGFSLLKGGENGDWNGEIPLLTRAMKLDEDLAFINVFSLKPDSVEDALQLAPAYLSKVNFQDAKPDSQIEFPKFSEEFKTNNISYKKILDDSLGNILIERPYGNDADDTSLQEFKVTEWQVVVLKKYIEDKDSEVNLEILFWINNANTGEPIKDIDIAIIRKIDEDVVLEGETITDVEGMAQITMSKCSGSECEIVYWMRTDEASALYEDEEHAFPSDFGHKVKMSLAIDRTVVFPGDSLKIAGFGTSLEKNKILPYGQNPKDTVEKNLTITPSLDPESEDSQVKIPVEFNPTYGTFQVPVDIPEDAKNGYYEIEIENAYISFVIGEPRSPTTEVTLEAPIWVQPNTTIEINVTIESLIGAVVANDEITLTWTINSDTPATNVTIVTNEDGIATYIIDLSTLPEDSVKAGDNIEIEITYIGPTRDVTTKSANVLVLMTDKEIRSSLSLDMEWPGIEFGVSASVYKETEDVKLDDDISFDLINIDDLEYDDSVILNYLNQPSVYSNYGEIVNNCTIKSDDTKYEHFQKCRVELLDIGRYALRYCIIGETPDFCTTQLKGKNISTWENDPIEENFKIETFVETEKIEYAGNATFYVDLPYENIKLLIYWGNEITTKNMTINFKKVGLYQFEVEIGDECKYGCQVSLVYVFPYQDTSFVENVPKDVTFDPQLPSSFSNSISLEIKDQDVPFKLNVSIILNTTTSEDEELILAPGETSEITVTVDACSGDPNKFESIACKDIVPVKDSEVVLFVIDKAFLQINENLLNDISSIAKLTWSSSLFESGSWPKNWLPVNSFDEALNIILRRLEIDPWLLKDFLANGDYLGSDFNKPDQYFLDGSDEWITFKPEEVLTPYTQIETLGSRTDGDATTFVSIRVEDEFEVTPVFTVLKTTSNGKATFNFTAPDSLSTYTIRAYASTKKAQYGSTEEELIVRLPLSLTPSTPRLVRVEDEFEAGVIVTVFGDTISNATLTVTLSMDTLYDNSIVYMTDTGELQNTTSSCDKNNDTCLEVIEEKIVETDIDGQIEVRFKFKAVKIGSGNFTISANLDDYSDGLEMSIPVYGQQEEISLATSFAIKGTEENVSEREEALVLPEAVPGSGEIELIAGISRLPTVLESAERILNSWSPDPYWYPDAKYAMANISLPLIFQYYGLHESTEYEDLYNSTINAFETSVNYFALGQLTKENCGITYKISSANEYCYDTYLTAQTICLSESVIRDLNTSASNVLKNGLDEIIELVKIWKSELELMAITEAYEYIYDLEMPYPIDKLSYVRHALGYDWSIEECPLDNLCTEEVIETLSMDRFNVDPTELSIGTKSRVIMTWLDANVTGEIEDYIASFENLYRVIGRTAYLSTGPSSNKPEDIESQSYALLSTLYAGGSVSELLEKLANFVSSDELNNYYFSFFDPMDKIVQMFALSAYDSASSGRDPNLDLDLVVTSNDTTLLEVHFDNLYDPIESVTEDFDNLESGAKIEFIVNGTGEASLTASMKFIPLELLPYPTYRGLFVERVIRITNLTDNSPIGSPLITAPLATSIVITIQVTTPDDLGSVTIIALMPGGLEPVDPLLSQSEDAQRICVNESKSFSIFPICPIQETSPERVIFKYNRLIAGTYTIDFQATTASVGNWTLPPVEAYVDQQPEVMGLSSASTFEVCEGDDCEYEYVSVSDMILPEECSNNCSDAGLCDASTGTCQCNVGFSGDDCSKLDEN